MQVSGVQSHKSLCSSEKYHEPLRRIFDKMENESPSKDRKLALCLAIKAINDTAGPEGLLSSLLVSENLSRFPM